ncbi:MAG: hypothetical protein JWP91_329 [Fibrobacteres bacterium]|nr:hypothetical protein [Fibrobacterota bacterium]
MKMNHGALRAAAALALSLWAGLASGQSDPLISKTISHVLADQDGFWAFAGDGLHFSRIDPFKEPLDIRNGSLPFKAGIRGGVGRKASALVFFDNRSADTTFAGIAALGQDGKSPMDSILFVRPAGQNKAVTVGVEFSALALWHDTVVVGGGNAGFALAKAKPEGQGALGGDSLIFRALPEDEDTAIAALRCAIGKACLVSPIAEVADKIGFPDSVAALAVDSASGDSVWLLIGTHTGLRRGLLSGRAFPEISLPTAKPGSPIHIERIHADAARNILWVFSGSEYFFSGDHGRTFHTVPRIAGIVSSPDSLTGFSPVPEAANIDDTTFINFNLDNPGLVAFRKDTVLANRGTGDFADLILDAADSLPIQRGQGRLTDIAVVRKGGRTALMAGSTSKGLFLRKTGGSNGGAWANVNSLKELKGGLEEVITFPTLFSGTAPDGSPEFVNLGYRLKKDGKVTITVYNYAMEKVKTIVKNARRTGGGNRSENPAEDRWDGKDASGRHVSVGTYYILIQTDKGEKGWGKAIAVHGRGL